MPSMAALAEVAERLPLPIGNPAFTPDGRLFASRHPMFETGARVSEVVAPGVLRPFPDARWNDPAASADQRLDAVPGLRSDAGGRMRLLDMGSRSGTPPRFVVWDARGGTGGGGRLDRLLPITPSALTRHSEPNDFVLDARNGAACIADEGVGRNGDGSGGALIVVDLATGLSRRRLHGTQSARAEPVPMPMLVDGREVRKTAKDGSTSPMRVGCDGIMLDHRSEWLHYGPASGGASCRVRVADLLDSALPDAELARRVERCASRPNAGGYAIDSEDNLYMTELGGRAIGVIPAADRTYRQLAEHPEMLWPDGLAWGPDGMLHVAVSQLPLAAQVNGGTRGDRQPHLLMRVRPLAPGRVAG